MKIKKILRNPLLTPAGITSAWFLFHELRIRNKSIFSKDIDPLQNFPIFRNILRRAILRDSKLYRPKTKEKSNGKKRIIMVPCWELKRIQQRIDQVILKPQKRLPYTYGFSGGSVRQAVEHVAKANQAVFATDIVEAFPSTNTDAVYNVFKELDYGMNASYYLTCLSTWIYSFRHLKQFLVGPEHWRYVNVWSYKFGLPQGAPTSPRLFDLCFRPIDKQLNHFAEKIGGTYVRYADNLFITAPQFWPAIQRTLYGMYMPRRGRHADHDEVRKEIKTAEGVVNVEKNESGGINFHSPVISAVFKIVEAGYWTNHIPFFTKTKHNQKKWDDLRKQIHFQIHKNFLARPDQVFHALGLNLIDGQLHNTRGFKNRFRMTVFNLQKALEQKDDFEDKIWPLYVKLKGMRQWAVEKTLSAKLLEQFEELSDQIEGIRYSGPSGIRVKNITTY